MPASFPIDQLETHCPQYVMLIVLLFVPWSIPLDSLDCYVGRVACTAPSTGTSCVLPGLHCKQHHFEDETSCPTVEQQQLAIPALLLNSPYPGDGFTSQAHWILSPFSPFWHISVAARTASTVWATCPTQRVQKMARLSLLSLLSRGHRMHRWICTWAQCTHCIESHQHTYFSTSIHWSCH